jgi:predicted naringenin-chalcone synthase
VVGWNPWRELRRRKHLRLQYAYLHPSRGRIVDHGDGLRTITIDRRLRQDQRNDTLSHELVHDELDLLFDSTAPAAVVEKVERIVEKISDERQLPLVDLEAYVERRGGEVIYPWQVAEDLDVCEEVAERQMRYVAWGF